MIYNNIAVIFVVVLHMSNGGPLETKTVDFSSFFQSSRIVGGEDAPEKYQSYQAVIVINGIFLSPLCGASIIHKKIILTAAHCIDPLVSWWTGELMPSAKAIVGSNSWEHGGIEVHFESYHNHPQWNPYTIKNDIGMLYLAKKLDFNERVRPVAINYERVDAGEKSFVTGWGLTSAWGELPRVLQLLYVQVISDKECMDEVQAAAGPWGPNVDPVLEICTFHSYGHGMCNGDSGSALMSVKHQKQIGIVSWGFPCALGKPDVFTRMTPHKDFIDNILNADSSNVTIE